VKNAFYCLFSAWCLSFYFMRQFVKTNIYFSAAESAFDSGKYEDAIKYYDKVIEADSGNAMAYLGKGLALDALGNTKKPWSFRQSIEINKDLAKAYNAKGTTLASLERYEESLENFKKAAELKPKNSAYQNDVAYGLNNLGRFEEAIQYAEKALKLNPRSGVAYSNKGFALDALGKLDEAIECYDKAIELSPPIPMPTTTSPLQFSKWAKQKRP